MKTKKISWQAIAIVVLALVLIASIALGVSGAWFQDKDSDTSDAKLGHAVTVTLQDADAKTDGVKNWSTIYDSAKTYAYPGDQIVGKTRIMMGSTSPALIRINLVPSVTDSTTAPVDLTGAITLEAISGVNAPTKLKAGEGENQAEIDAAIVAYYNALIAKKPTKSNNDDYETEFATYKGLADNWNKWLLKNMTSSISLDTNKWTQGSDKKWYYNTVFGATEALSGATSEETGAIALFDAAYLSPYLTNEVAQWNVNIKLEVEAIQAAHANEATHPWNSELVKTELEDLYGTEAGAATTVCGYNAKRVK